MQTIMDIKLMDVVSLVPLQPFTFSEDEPLIIMGFLLSIAKKENLLVKSIDGSYIGEVGTIDLFQAFYPDFKNVWQKLYRIKVKNAARKVRFLDADSPLGLYYFTLKKEGAKYTNAVVHVKGNPISFITPYSILSFMYRKDILPDVKISSIQNSLVRTDENISVKGAIKLMIERWIRKVFAGNGVVDDRGLVDHVLFNMNSLSSLAKDPESVLDKPLSSFYGLLKEPEVYRDNDDIYEVAKKVLVSETLCAVSEDMRYIITPFDIVIKPFI